jgi:TatD DNase family protein
MLIDTHCHLTYPGLLEQQDAVVQRATDAGVKRIITIGTHPADHSGALQAATRFEAVFAALGIHPHHAAEIPDDFLRSLEEQVGASDKILAIGECGLDYHGNSAPAAVQKKVFAQQLQLAQRLNLPVILHVRDAHIDTLEIMRNFAGVKFVVHCFSGTPDECRRWIELGAYVGFTGIITYKNAPDVREACRLVPDNRLLVETDAPYLSPQPVRKVKINEPAFVAHVAQQVAVERGCDAVRIAQLTTQNAGELFGVKLLGPLNP